MSSWGEVSLKERTLSEEGALQISSCHHGIETEFQLGVKKKDCKPHSYASPNSLFSLACLTKDNEVDEQDRKR